ncbi:hypothetical protein ACHAPJ_013034 [Fusarium lateritium]
MSLQGTQDSRAKKWLMGQSAFERRMPHHEGISALWETMWRLPCTKGTYPFNDGAYEDFEPIFQRLIAGNINDGASQGYTEAFFSTAESLEAKADEAMKKADSTRASALYLRAACVLRIGRFPYITAVPHVNDPIKWRAWEWQKTVYMKASATWTVPLTEIAIPHVFRKGADRETVPVYVRVPQNTEISTCPTILVLTGLDGYRPDFTILHNEFLSRGWAAVIAEVPGTADCPADSSDPDSPDRLWSSVLDWMKADGRFDMNRVLCWGLSTGGYYAVRIAHTHRARLIGCIAQGAGCHYFFDRDWIEKADGHEYPFKLSPAFAMKHGFESVEEYKEGVQDKFSLLKLGIIEQPSTRLLLINGMDDGLMPIEDSMMLFEYGSPKEARFIPGGMHMGNPQGLGFAFLWMEEMLAS